MRLCLSLRARREGEAGGRRRGSQAHRSPRPRQGQLCRGLEDSGYTWGITQDFHQSQGEVGEVTRETLPRVEGRGLRGRGRAGQSQTTADLLLEARPCLCDPGHSFSPS